MRPTFDVSGSLLWLFPPILVLMLLWLRRARVQMRAADPASLEQLRHNGVLRGDAGEQYGQLVHLLAGISPVVWLRERAAVRLYGSGVWLLYRWRPASLCMQRELAQVAAYQAHRYACALAQVRQLRDDRHWELQTVSKLPQ